MRCFLACFGLSKEETSSKETNSDTDTPVDQVPVFQEADDDILGQEIRTENEFTSPISPHFGDRLRKKVTFDSNVKIYEHVPVIKEDEDGRSENEGDVIAGEIRVSTFSESSQSHSSTCEDSSVISNSGLYPPNHRYRDCRESDDEFDEFEGLGDGDDCSDEEEHDYVDDDEEEEEEEDHKDSTPKLIVGDRSTYNRSVLRPIENVNQLRAVKAAARRKIKEPLKREPNQDKIEVDASLSNWLRTSPSKNKKDENVFQFEKRSTESQSSNSVISFEDTPIIENFGSCWGDDGFETEGEGDSFPLCASSSFKGIPNSNTKYREDQRVKWHSTPFETRLERALKRVGGGVGCILHEEQ